MNFLSPFKGFVFFLLSLSTLCGFAKGAAAPAVADEIIESFVFDDSCDVGPWTKRALATSQTLTSIYASLQKKTNCGDSAITASINAATQISTTLGQLSGINAAREEKVQMESINDLLSSLQDPTLDPAVRAVLLSEYSNQRVQLAQTRGVLAADSTLNNTRLYYGLESIATYMNTLVSQRSALQACFTANPVEAVKVATNLADLAGNFLPSIQGAAVKVGAAITRDAIDAFQNAPIAAEIRRTQNTRLTLGLRCGMQTMLRQYCGARDASKLVSYLNKDATGLEPSAFFYGLDLIDNRFPVLDGWLDRVANGVKPRTADAANKMNTYFSLVNLASSTRREMDGRYQELIDNLTKVSSLEGQRDQVKFHLETLITQVWGAAIPGENSRYNGVFYGRKNAMELAVEIFGESMPDGQQDFSSYLGGLVKKHYFAVADLVQVNSKCYEVFERRESEIKRDFKDHVNVDSPNLVRSATSSQLTQNSAFEVLLKINHFFDRFTFDDAFGAQDQILIDGLKTRLGNLATSLGDPRATTDDNSNTIIAATYDAFSLQDQNIFLNQRLRSLISNDLESRVKKGELPRELVDIAWMANQDLTNVFSQTHQKADKYLVQSDVDQAQQQLGGSLLSFTSFFSQSILTSMTKMEATANANQELTFAQMRAAYAKDPNVYLEEPNRKTLGLLCIIALSANEALESRACRGAFVISTDAKLILDYDTLSQRLHKRPFKERVCVYDDFIKKDRIASQSVGLPRDNHNWGPRSVTVDDAPSSSAQPKGELSAESRALFQMWVDSER